MFQSRSFGKCILAGEHSVLRGHKALALPVASCYFDLKFSDGSESSLTVSGESAEQIEFAFLGGLERAIKLLDKNRNDIVGSFEIFNSIPLGTGMGGSAGICVAIARFVAHKSWISESEIIAFATEIEHLFHGKSSGVDVAVSAIGAPIVFLRDQGFEALEYNWQPKLALSFSGTTGFTAECIEQVEQIIKSQARLGERIDNEMARAVDLMEKSLQQASGFQDFAEAMKLANTCFQDWQLINPELEKHMAWVKEKGACSLKPTGSGLGGYVLSLWEQEVPGESRFKPL